MRETGCDYGLPRCREFATIYVRRTRAWYCVKHATILATDHNNYMAGIYDRCEEIAFYGIAYQCELPDSHTRYHMATVTENDRPVIKQWQREPTRMNRIYS